LSNLSASPLFLVGAIALVVAALAFLLLPMLRGGGEASRLRRRRKALEELRDELSESEYRERIARIDAQRKTAGSADTGSTRGLAFMLLAAVPLIGAVLYFQIGSPQGINPETGQTGQLREMLGDLTRQVKSEPEDIDAWNQLGMIYKQIQQYPAAESAFRRVVFLEPDNTLARVELAETLLFQGGQANLPQESDRLLRQVLAREPENQKALWLAGLGAFQSGNRARALTLWRRLEALLPEGAVRDRIREQIASATDGPALASARGTEAPRDAIHAAVQRDDAAETASSSPSSTASAAPTTPETSEPAPAASTNDRDSGTRVAVEISVDDAVASRLGGAETVFVFARAVNGPAAPLAVKRLAASALPTTVILSEADSMAEGLTLGTFPTVSVTARVSRTGNVIAAAGDLQGQSDAFDPKSADQVSVSINEIVQ
jgi:cytochrome c-type biogenesis protein CcmH